MNRDHLDFEKPIIELETKISELRELASVKGMDVAKEIKSLESKAFCRELDIRVKMGSSFTSPIRVHAGYGKRS